MSEANAKSRRRWRQFSLRSLLVAVTLVAGLLVAWRAYVEPYRIQRKAAARFRQLGATVETVTGGPQWARKIFGVDRLQEITRISFPRMPKKLTFIPELGVFLNPPSLTVGENLVRYNIDADDFFTLPRMRRLASLELAATEVSDEALKKIGRLSQLESLDLSFTPVTDMGIEELRGLRSLKKLHLKDVAITDESLHYLQELEHLEFLDLSGTNITDTGLSAVGRMRSLKSLRLNDTSITDVGLFHLRTLRQLEHLSIISTNISGAGFGHLKNMTKLKTIDLSGNDITLEIVHKYLPHVKTDRDGAWRKAELVEQAMKLLLGGKKGDKSKP